MAPNSSSVFNEAPAEAKPATSSPQDAPLMAPPTTNATTDARPVPTVATNSPVTTAAKSTDCLKQVAPKMEQAVEEGGTTLPDAFSATTMRSLTFRKSCLKRSNSSLPVPHCPHSVESVKVDAIDIKPAEEAKEPIPQVPVQKNRRRCWECKAKVSLTAVTCRCDYTFCNKHRYAEEHNCRFNFKGAAKRKLEEENPRVVPRKVARIN